MSFRRPKISVILASYNHEKFIEQSVNSVLSQTYSDLELIVIDDASSDRTPGIVENIKDPRLKLVRLDENRRYHPRNIGIRRAKGKYIAFQNSDDVWHETKLEAQIREMETRNDLTGCFTQVEIIDQEGKKDSGTWAENLFAIENRPKAEWLNFFFHHGNTLCVTSAVTRRKEVIGIDGFDPTLFQLSDYDLWVRLAAKGELHILPERLTRMRVVEGKNLSQPSGTTNRRSIIEQAQVLERYAELPVYRRLDEIFEGQIPGNYRTRAPRLAWLALHSLSLTAPHRLFADRLLARLLGDSSSREEIIRAFGIGIIQEFIRNRGELNLTIEDNHEQA